MKRTVFTVSGLFFLSVFGGPWGPGPGPSALPGGPLGLQTGPPAGISTSFVRMPMYFCPNKGQLDERVAFSVQGSDRIIYFTSEGLTLVLTRPATGREAPSPAESAGPARSGPDGGSREVGNRPESWVMKLDFVGANESTRPVGENETGARVSYFKGPRQDWLAGLPTYSRIVYRDLWPGIDLAYSGTLDQLKYEFIVHPGADPSRVRLAYRGSDRLAVDETGRLEVTTSLGIFHDGKPTAYQEIGATRKPVSLAYKVDGSNYGFTVGDYDPALPLVLDPLLMVYCGFIGGSSTDYGWGIAADGGGNIYVTGYTVSGEATFPESVGPDLSFNGGAADAFVAKVNAAGTALVYCGYIGGSADDKGYAIAADAAGNAYVAGFTASTEASFPVFGGPDLFYAGGTYDGFVAKVNAAGTALDYCGYVGGALEDECLGVAVDASGQAYLTGYTLSTPPNFPVIAGPDLIHNGAADAFVAKVNAGGTAMTYCGYIGGSSDDYGAAIALDRAGNAYVAGYTASTQATFPVAVGPDLSHNGSNDAFVTKVNAAGTALDYCGYIGGSSADVGRGIAVDRWGGAYVSGYTGSVQTTFPVLVGPDLTHNGNTDAFAAKVNAAGTGLAYCGYIGGTSNDYGYALAVDDAGNAFVVGSTASSHTSFPVLVGPDLIWNGGNDAFVAKVNVSGKGLSYCGYLGGNLTDNGFSVAVDGWGNAYLTGYAQSTQAYFSVVTGPDLTHNGGSDVFVARIYTYEPPARQHAAGDYDGDGSDELAVDFGAAGVFLWDAGAWSQILSVNSEGLIAVNLDDSGDDEMLADLGGNGLWVWNNGNWGQLSGLDVETMCAGDLDGDAGAEICAGFGGAGVWLNDGGAWSQISGVKAEYLVTADLDGSGGQEILADFGAVGMWMLSGGAWTQLSGVNADGLLAGNADGFGGDDLIGDFGPIGLWLYSGGGWTQLSGVNADQVILADADGGGDEELFGDFAFTGLWRLDGGGWDILSGLNLELVAAADSDGDGMSELAIDFGAIGVWLWDAGSWNQISGVDAENLLAGDTNGDNVDELGADFGSLGLWLWDAGAWTQISADNPD